MFYFLAPRLLLLCLSARVLIPQRAPPLALGSVTDIHEMADWCPSERWLTSLSLLMDIPDEAPSEGAARWGRGARGGRGRREWGAEPLASRFLVTLGILYIKV